jgi:hypothetical protein
MMNPGCLAAGGEVDAGEQVEVAVPRYADTYSLMPSRLAAIDRRRQVSTTRPSY